MENRYKCCKCKKQYYEFSEQAEDGNLDWCIKCSDMNPGDFGDLVKQLER